MSARTRELSEIGVSIWLDDLSRQRIESGELARLIDELDVVGVTTNPTIFAAALADGGAYEEQVAKLVGAPPEEAVNWITTEDVQRACDVFLPVHERTAGRDGRVSIEVSPLLADDTDGTVAQAEWLWSVIRRPNAMIKIPATKAGLPAITRTLAKGISVNVTLIFSIERYREVVAAYLAGLEQAAEAGHDLSTIRSVASFFVSRVDTEVDRRLAAIGTEEAAALRSRAGVANARLAYEAFEQEFAGERFAALRALGAHRQRPLWASTGVKDPALPDTLYVTELAAADTVNTMPEKTLLATAGHAPLHGDAVTGTYEQARSDLAALAAVGIDIDEVTELLEREGVDKFVVSWNDLLTTVSEALERAGGRA